ncbi:MAG: DUF2892 domain-containing protein [Chromatiaceae bacterium]|jgi:hypothetical protein
MNLPKNIGATDRNVRLAAAGILILFGIIIGKAILTILGLVVLATAAVGTCPAYIPLNINTKKEGDS